MTLAALIRNVPVRITLLTYGSSFYGEIIVILFWQQANTELFFKKTLFI